MAPGVRELLVLAALAAFGCGLALAQGDFLFAAIFGAANAVATIEAIRRSRSRPFGRNVFA
jgi:hypothetical protein